MNPGPAGLVLCACLFPWRLAGQAPSHQPRPLDIAWLGPVGDPTLDPFLDSLQRVATVEALRVIDQRWDPRVQHVRSPLGRLRLGFHDLRRGQLEGTRKYFDKARETLARAAAETPDDPLPWYALALANLELRRRDYPDPSVTQDHMSGYLAYYLGARRALQRSLEADAAFAPALLMVERLAVLEGDRSQPSFMTAALEQRIARDSGATGAWLALGRQRRVLGDLDRALQAFRNYRHRGGDSGVADLELARTLAAAEAWDEAIRAYHGGARAMGEAGRRLLRADLAWVATPTELAEFDALAADSVAPWIEGFWSRRDLESLRAPGSRLREHLRRWSEIHRAFRVTRPEARAIWNPRLGAGPAVCSTPSLLLDEMDFANPARPHDLRGWEPFLDDRAIMYVRHGEPIKRSWTAHAFERRFDGQPSTLNPRKEVGYSDDEIGAAPESGPAVMETWAYWIEGEPRVFFFGPSSALGYGPTSLSATAPPAALLEALEGLWTPDFQPERLRRDLARLRHDGQVRAAGFPRAMPSARCYAFYQRYRTWSEESVKTAVRTDGDVLFFPRNLYPTVQVMGMPGARGAPTGKVVVAYAVPVERLEFPKGATSVPLRLRIAGIRDGTRDGFWVDTTHTLRVTEALTADSYVSGLLELPVPPATYHIRVAVQLADSSAGNAIDVPGAATTWVPDDTLRLSDIVAGGGSDNMLWSSLGESVSVNVLAAYQSRDTVELYYVQGGLRPGAGYRTEIVLTKAGDHDKVQSFTFEESAARVLEGKRRGLALEDVESGVYDLTVTLREARGGRSITRTRRITVVM